jgi:guanylate kinase
MPTGLAPKGNGKAIIFSAPSGAGKTTMVKGLMASSTLSLGFSISATTRPPRGDEKDGEAYYYLTQQEFDSKVKNGDFIEWEEVYPGLCYGTLRSEVERMWSEGIHPVFDVDVVGGLALKKVFGRSAISVFVMPPSIEILEQRLRGRGTESEKNIVRRLAKAGKEIQLAESFDVRLVNNDLQKAILTIINTVVEFLKP